jgi:hypothetical protein
MTVWKLGYTLEVDTGMRIWISRVMNTFFFYRYSALGPVRAETRAQSGDWYGSGKLHPGQILRGSLPLLSPDEYIAYRNTVRVADSLCKHACMNSRTAVYYTCTIRVTQFANKLSSIQYLSHACQSPNYITYCHIHLLPFITSVSGRALLRLLLAH